MNRIFVDLSYMINQVFQLKLVYGVYAKKVNISWLFEAQVLVWYNFHKLGDWSPWRMAMKFHFSVLSHMKRSKLTSLKMLCFLIMHFHLTASKVLDADIRVTLVGAKKSFISKLIKILPCPDTLFPLKICSIF